MSDFVCKLFASSNFPTFLSWLLGGRSNKQTLESERFFLLNSFCQEMKTTDFIDKLNAQNSKITVLGTYERNNSKIAVKCDICGWEWTPIPYSLLKGHGCPKCARVKQKTHAEFVEELQSQRDDVVLIGRYVKALEKAKFRCLKCGHEWNAYP